MITVTAELTPGGKCLRVYRPARVVHWRMDVTVAVLSDPFFAHTPPPRTMIHSSCETSGGTWSARERPLATPNTSDWFPGSHGYSATGQSGQSTV